MKLENEIEQNKEIQKNIEILRKTFKNYSKNQLINMLIQQMIIAVDNQNANKVLFEENRKLKEGKNE